MSPLCRLVRAVLDAAGLGWCRHCDARPAKYAADVGGVTVNLCPSCAEDAAHGLDKEKP